MRMASFRPSTYLSRAENVPSPKARNSSSEYPPPSPSISLPPDRRANVSAIFATIAGFR